MVSEKQDSRVDRRTVLRASGATSVATALGSLAFTTSDVGHATPGREPGPKPNEVLVGVSAGAGDLRAVASEHAPPEADVVHTNETLRYAAVAFPESAPESALDRYVTAVTDDRRVKYAERNGTYETQLTPDDPKYSDQYAPQQVTADTAWDTTLGDSSVTIAVVDTGVQYDHPDLTDNFRSDPGKDFVDDDGDPYPDDLSKEDHATHVSGIAAGKTDNGTGIAGISDCQLINGRALDEDGRGSWSDIADAIEWAADQGADVINMSLGGSSGSDAVKNAVAYAYDEGSLPIAAAGNDSGDVANSYPAAYEKVMAISALDPDESFASYSNYGEEIDVCAPGTDVLSSVPDDSYDELSGTSMACPVASGVAGLACSQYDLKPGDLEAHLEDTAVDVGLSSDEQGSGRVDAANAVETAPDSCGATSNATTVRDQLSGYADSDCWMREWEYDAPCQVVVELSGPSDADFDLYVNDGTGTCPTTDDYDYRSWTIDSQESITIDDPDTSAPLYVLVDAWSGVGEYELTITEKSD